MRDWYKAGDKKLEALNRENARIFRKSRLTLDFDNINQPVKEIRSEAKRVYRKLKKKSDKAYIDIGLLVYMEAFEEATDAQKANTKTGDTEPEVALPDAEISEKSKKAIDEKWLEEFHREYNPVTKYVYENELERKQARFFESIVADVEAKDRHEMEADYKAAENAWKRQTRQAMIDTEDRAAVTAYRDAGVEEVMWISVCDNRTCEECGAMNGLIFPVDSVPDKPHYNCRCHLEPVRRLPKQLEDDIIVSGALNGFSKEANDHAERYYGLVRAMKTDYQRIAQNVGWKPEVILNIKRHVFTDKHMIDGEMRTFDPSYFMAESWQRLIQGGDRIQEQDIVLLKHEYLESILEKKGILHDAAHEIAQSKHNYSRYLPKE